jgi:hypothetical protein
MMPAYEPYCECLQEALYRLCDELPSELDMAFTPNNGVSGAKVVISSNPDMLGWRWADKEGGVLEVTLGDYGHSKQVDMLREYVIEALTLDFRYGAAPTGPNPTSI